MGGVALAVVSPEVYGRYGRVNGGLQEGLHQGGPSRTAAANVPVPVMSLLQLTSPQETLKHSQAGLDQSPVGSSLLSPGSYCAQD